MESSKMRLGQEYVREGKLLTRIPRIRPITADMVLYTCGMCERMANVTMKPVSAVLTYINPDTGKRYSLTEAIEIVKEIGLDPVDEDAAEYERRLNEE
jgi:hypothetical protein